LHHDGAGPVGPALRFGGLSAGLAADAKVKSQTETAISGWPAAFGQVKAKI
jgi:hypothetical protein